MSLDNNSIQTPTLSQEAFNKAEEILMSYQVSTIDIKRGLDGKYHYIYLTQNLTNGRFYIGKHTHTNHHNTYIGSGNKQKAKSCPLNLAIEKYGKSSFKKTILRFFKTSEEAYEAEKELLSLEFIKKYGYVGGSLKLCYNIKVGGKGGMLGFTQTEETKAQRRENQKKAFSTEEHKKRRSEAVKKIWEETKEVRRLNMKKRLANFETKERQRQASKQRNSRIEVREILKTKHLEVKANRVMLDSNGCKHPVHKDFVLEKLKEGWRLASKTIGIVNPATKEAKTLVLNREDLCVIRQHKKLINFLEQEWILGVSSKLDKETRT